MKQITLILNVHVAVDDVDAGRVAAKLRYAVSVLASDGLLSPDDIEIIAYDSTVEVHDLTPNESP